MEDQEVSTAVGWRFHPTDQEIVTHFLRNKLLADDPSINHTLPENGVCKYEPWDLLDWVTSAALATKFDEFQCFFFSPCDYKYSNSNRFNRTTLYGFWKVTGVDRKIKQRGTNNVIGTKKTLVFHKRCGNRGVKTNWVIHEYHDLMFAPTRRSHVLCWLKKNSEKKTKEKSHQLLDEKGDSTIEAPPHPDGAIDSVIQAPPQPDGGIDSMIQAPPQPDGAIDSMIQARPQPNGTIDSMIQAPLQPDGAIDSMIQAPLQPDGVIDIYSMIPPLQSIEVIDSMIQAQLQPNEAVNPFIQLSQQLNEVVDPVVQTPFEPDETVISNFHTRPPEPNSNVETIYDSSELESNLFDTGELVSNLFDVGEYDFTSLLQLSPSMDEPVLFETLATSAMHWHEA